MINPRDHKKGVKLGNCIPQNWGKTVAHQGVVVGVGIGGGRCVVGEHDTCPTVLETDRHG